MVANDKISTSDIKGSLLDVYETPYSLSAHKFSLWTHLDLHIRWFIIHKS